MAFGLKYYAELRSRYKEIFWRVEIAERCYTGKAEEMPFCGESPMIITWEKRGDEFFVPVKGTEASIHVMCYENFHYLNLFTSDPRKFRVSIHRNTKLFWRGYVVADLYSETFTAPPYGVAIKAVDGFNLLSSIPFMQVDGSKFIGKKSLWELITLSIDVLELEVDVADWMDLYADGMDEKQSPLHQAFIDMERLYSVYEEPTYRDVLELCLQPFSGQIFQSYGTLHIRRTVTLYNNSRPISFYSIAKEFPTGWIVAADGKDVVSAEGEIILTNASRERIESIWDDDINISGNSTLEIVPAIRKATVTVKNKALDNILPQMGIFNLANWVDPSGYLTLTDACSINLYGDRDGKDRGDIAYFKGFPVEQCNYKLLWEFVLNGRSSRERTTSVGTNGVSIDLLYGMKIVSEAATYYLQENGTWSTTETWLADTVSTATDANKKFEIMGFPISGQLIIYIKQTLYAFYTGRNGYSDSCTFEKISLTMDTGELYENSLKQELFINRANNVDLGINLPIADIPNIPNDRLISSLYFLDNNNLPTRIWHTKGKNDYNSLVNHIIDCSLRYKQSPSRKVYGAMFTGKHIDMNTVVQDDKYLFAGFYVNSLELNNLDDEYDSELIEMPGLVRVVTPPEGDDCIQLFSLPTIIKAIRSEHLIVLLTAERKVLTFDTYSGYLTELIQLSMGGTIFPADNSFVVVDNNRAAVVDYKGGNSSL